MKINIQSDLFYQIKPSRLLELKELINTGSKHAACKFITRTVPHRPKNNEIWAIHCVNFTNQQIYDLLTKSVDKIKNTEEFVEYQLKTTFNFKDKNYSIPPGTIRIYSQDLLCFYNGKIWKKLEL